MSSITINKVKHIYSKNTASYQYTFDDGTKFIIVSSMVPTSTDISAAYLKQYSIDHPVSIGGGSTGTGTGGNTGGGTTNPPGTNPTRVVPTGSVESVTWSQLQNLNNVSNKYYKLVAGTYTGQSNLTDCSNIYLDLSLATFTGSGAPIFQLNGLCNNMTFSAGKFTNVGSACISYRFETAYNSSNSSTYVNNLTIQDCVCDNTGVLFENDGNMTSSGFKGVFTNTKIIYNTIKNSANIGNVAYLFAADNFLIANNVVDNINTGNTNHNGIFMVLGNGTFINNKFTNYQGGTLRLNPLQISGSYKTSTIQNNIAVNSTKYGAFEVQLTPDQLPTAIPLNNILVDHNTVGNLGLIGRGTDADWNSTLIDIYPVKTTVTITNNLGFNLFLINGNTVDNNMLDSQNATGDTIVTDNNHYFLTSAQAVSDLTSFRSLVSGVGASIS